MKIGIVGCAGRMGRMLLAQVLCTDGCELAGGTERPGHDSLGQDLGLLAGTDAIGLAAAEDAGALFDASDAVIDFTGPDAIAGHGSLAAERGVALVVGTTGLDRPHLEALNLAARRTAVMQAANMSVGVNLLLGLARQAAALLGNDYDIEIMEMHHRHKVDAPSGTALALGEAVAEARGVQLDDAGIKVRDGMTGPRRRGDIGFASLRGGDVAGEHTVIFATDGEQVLLTHKASSRTVFAAGAVNAALWCEGREPGLYTMRHVLGLD
jgi:4-hydroxy-tetrahydrodipicolinate reductase